MNLRKDHYHTKIHTIYIPFIVSVWMQWMRTFFMWMYLFSFYKHYITYKKNLIFSNIWENSKISYNLQRRISWLSQRWRTQRNAIRNANCRLSESSKFWTQVALPGFPGSMLVSVSVTLTHIIGMWIMTVFFLFFNGNQLKWSRCFIMSFHIWHTC